MLRFMEEERRSRCGSDDVIIDLSPEEALCPGCLTLPEREELHFRLLAAMWAEGQAADEAIKELGAQVYETLRMRLDRALDSGDWP
jgi:hypothetical protein